MKRPYYCPKMYLGTSLLFWILSINCFGYTILWDTSHGVADSGQYQPSGYYQTMTQHLNSAGFTMDVTSDGFLAEDIFAYDVIVVSSACAVSSDYSTAEVDRITEFVNGGGGLMIMGGHPYSPNSNIQAVADVFDITLGFSSLNLSDFSTAELSEHKIFDNFLPGQKLYMLEAGSLALGDSAEALAWRDDKRTDVIAAFCEYGAGRVVTIGDFNMFAESDSIVAFSMVNNAVFCTNSFEYLAVPEPITIAMLGFGGLFLAKKRR